MAEPNVLSEFNPPQHDHRRCVDDALEQAEAACRDRGLRMTTLRRRVLELVWQNHQPTKAYDLLAKLHDEGRRAAPPTVYRALEFLLDAGLIHRLQSLNAYIGCPSPDLRHSGQFLICNQCHTVAELNDASIREALRRQARRLGFEATNPTIEISGICPRCSRQGGPG